VLLRWSVLLVRVVRSVVLPPNQVVQVVLVRLVVFPRWSVLLVQVVLSVVLPACLFAGRSGRALPPLGAMAVARVVCAAGCCSCRLRDRPCSLHVARAGFLVALLPRCSVVLEVVGRSVVLPRRLELLGPAIRPVGRACPSIEV